MAGRREATVGVHCLGGAMDPGDHLDQVLDKDLPLREDIRLLGRLLGDTLRDQEARAELEAMLCGLSRDATVLVARAFTYFSQLSNIAEDLHHVRRRRAYQLAGSSPQEGGMARAFQRAADAGLGPEELQAFFSGALVSP